MAQLSRESRFSSHSRASKAIYDVTKKPFFEGVVSPKLQTTFKIWRFLLECIPFLQRKFFSIKKIQKTNTPRRIMLAPTQSKDTKNCVKTVLDGKYDVKSCN